MTFKDRLKRAREAANLTQKDIADRFGMTPQAVSEWERGKTVPEIEKLPSIAQQVGRSVDWLLGMDDVRSEDVAHGLQMAPGQKFLRVAGYVGANGKTGFYDLAHDRYETIPGAPDDPEGAVALEIMGTSAGRWFDRWYVVFNDVRSHVTPDMIGQPCVVWLYDDRILFKEIRRNGALFDLLSNDPNEPPIRNVKIKSAARVLRIIQP